MIELTENQTHISDNVKREIEKYIKDNAYGYNEVCKEYKVDFFNLNNLLFRLENKKYKEIVSKKEQQNGYIENARFNIEVEIETKL